MITIDPIRKLGTFSLVRYNNDKVSFPIPESFIEAHHLQPKDDMEIYRDRINGHDALIIIPRKSVENNNHSEPGNNAGEEKPALAAESKMV